MPITVWGYARPSGYTQAGLQPPGPTLVRREVWRNEFHGTPCLIIGGPFLLLIVFGDMARLARVVVLGLPHQITRRETSGRRPSSTTIIAARTDPISEARCLKPAPTLHFCIASVKGPFGIVGWYRAGNGHHI